MKPEQTYLIDIHVWLWLAFGTPWKNQGRYIDRPGASQPQFSFIGFGDLGLGNCLVGIQRATTPAHARGIRRIACW